MARYVVQPDKVEEANSAIATFIDAIRDNEPGVLRYESFRRPSGRAFLHFMQFADAAAERRHRAAEPFEASCGRCPVRLAFFT